MLQTAQPGAVPFNNNSNRWDTVEDVSLFYTTLIKKTQHNVEIMLLVVVTLKAQRVQRVAIVAQTTAASATTTGITSQHIAKE
jgi:hypothetical protein